MHRFHGFSGRQGEFRRWLPEGYSETCDVGFEAGLPVTDLDAHRAFRVVAEPPRFFLSESSAPSAADRFRLGAPTFPDVTFILLNDA